MAEKNIRGSKAKSKPTDDVRWWNYEWDDPHMIATAIRAAESARSASQVRHTADANARKLYEGAGIDITREVQGGDDDPLRRIPIIRNLCRKIVRSSVTRVCKGRPRAMLLTTAGKWRDRVRALKLERVIAAQMKETGWYDVAESMVRDAAVNDSGTGFGRIYHRDGRLCCERIYTQEICIHPRDAVFGVPRNVFRWHAIDRAVLREMYPNKASKIDKLAAMQLDDRWSYDLVEERSPDPQIGEDICVWTCHHLASGPGAEDGMWCVVAGDVLLDSGECDEHFPYLMYQWEAPLTGFWSIGQVRDIQGHQYEVQAVTHASRLALRGSVPRTYVPKSAKIRAVDLDDRIGTTIEYYGQTPPMFVAPPPYAPGWLQHMQYIAQCADDDTGTSAQASKGELPPGVRSGIAIERVNVLDDTRFLVQARNYEALICEAARVLIDLNVELAEEGSGYKVRGWDKKRLTDRVAWRDLQLDAEEYVVQVYPVSALPSDPVGKTDLVEQWFQTGLIDADTRRELSGFPDTDAYADLIGAPRDWVTTQIESILLDGVGLEKAQPEPMMDLACAWKLGLLYYAAANRDGCPEERLTVLRRWLEKVKGLADAAQPAAQPAEQLQQPQQPQPQPQPQGQA